MNTGYLKPWPAQRHPCGILCPPPICAKHITPSHPGRIAPDDTATEGLVGLNRGELLCWLQALTERCNVCLSDFSGSWADGTALLAVVDRLDPAAGHWATLAALSPEERTVACMEVPPPSLPPGKAHTTVGFHRSFKCHTGR